MAKQDQIRLQLQNKIFTPYGKTISLYSPSTSISYNSRGERDSDTIYTTTSIVIVDYDIIDRRHSHEEWGSLKEGERLFITQNDTVISEDDYLLIGVDQFKIVDIERPSLPGDVVQIIKVVKTEDVLTLA